MKVGTSHVCPALSRSPPKQGPANPLAPLSAETPNWEDTYDVRKYGVLHRPRTAQSSTHTFTIHPYYGGQYTGHLAGPTIRTVLLDRTNLNPRFYPNVQSTPCLVLS